MLNFSLLVCGHGADRRGRAPPPPRGVPFGDRGPPQGSQRAGTKFDYDCFISINFEVCYSKVIALDILVCVPDRRGRVALRPARLPRLRHGAARLPRQERSRYDR